MFFNFRRIKNNLNFKRNMFSNISRLWRGYKVLNDNQLMFALENGIIILDVRTKSEYMGIHLKNAINIPLNEINNNMYNVIKDRNEKILVYCKTGERTIQAINKLNNLGYSNIYIWGNGGLNTFKFKDMLES